MENQFNEEEIRHYHGRYAPSPTGELHIGNLATALIAWLHARLSNGSFIIRIEDIDTRRCIKGSASNILNDLERLGIDWDGPVSYQSKRLEYYQDALESLEAEGLIYPCYCSRRDIKQATGVSYLTSQVYPGTCNSLTKAERQHKGLERPSAYRVRVPDKRFEYHDLWQGRIEENLYTETGDFVIKRNDGLFSYQLATTVDDIDQSMTHIVRAEDLLSVTLRQLYLVEQLKPETKIQFAHSPILVTDNGKKMSKRDGSFSLSRWSQPIESLIGWLAFNLGLTEFATAISSDELLDSLNLKQMNTVLSRAQREIKFAEEFIG